MLDMYSLIKEPVVLLHVTRYDDGKGHIADIIEIGVARADQANPAIRTRLDILGPLGIKNPLSRGVLIRAQIDDKSPAISW